MARRSGVSRRSRAEWAEVVRRWRSSGLSRAEFAARLGVEPATLTWWSWRLCVDGVDVAVPVVPTLARVVVRGETAAEPVIAEGCYDWELTTADGHTLRVRRGVRSDGLSEVLAVLVERAKR